MCSFIKDRPRGSSDIFAESAWRPSLERYINGETSDRRSIQDQEMLAKVYAALQNRDELLVVCVSMFATIGFGISPIADQSHRVIDHRNAPRY